MRRRRPRALRGATIAIALLLAGCDPNIVIGSDPSDAGLTPLDFPWSTSFEDGEADYQLPQGYCYSTAGGNLTIVGPPAPVHSGTHSAAFSVTTDAGPAFMSQVRCIRQGVLPQIAYYGAWYYLPAPVTNFGLWNLLHFQGADSPTDPTHGLWDVSLMNQPDGALHIYSYDFLRKTNVDAGGVPPIPIGTWFHLEVYWQRSAADAGEFSVYQDGQMALDLTGIPTDDSAWGQFYVGNLANVLAPSNVTLYVDDVSIGRTP